MVNLDDRDRVVDVARVIPENGVEEEEAEGPVPDAAREPDVEDDLPDAVGDREEGSPESDPFEEGEGPDEGEGSEDEFPEG